LDTQRLLLKLAYQNSDRVLHLWTSGPVSIPATGQGKARRLIAHAHQLISPKAAMITDRLTTHSSKAMSIQTTTPEVPQIVRVAAQSFVAVPERPLVLAPVPEAPQARTTQPEVRPSVPTEASAQSTPIQVAAETKSERLTRDASGNSWVILSSAGQTSVLFAQANSRDVSHFPTSAVTTQAQSQMASQGKPSAMENQSGTGMVSGWIPAGMTVKTRGAAQIDYYGSDAQTERYFVARGLKETAAVIQMVSEVDGEVVTAAGLPVLASSTTQVDLRNLQSVRISGNLWSSESPRPRGIAHAEIRLVGFPHRLAITARDGSFDLGEAQLPRGIATFLEARLPGGYTHRYALSALARVKPLNLFLFSDERIQGWVGSLEGGVSSSSGLIVASVKSEQAKMGHPVVKSLTDDSDHGAETYWLSENDELQEPIKSSNSRAPYAQWIGVEVTAKSVLAGLQSARGRWLQAEWIPTSPGVVSVLSPAE
jgi:hypothetical protein